MSQSMLQNALVAAAIGGVGLATYLIVNRHVPQEVAVVSSQPDAPSPAPEPAPVAEPVPAPGAPSFDVVRVTPEGSALVAGRAEPGATVTVLADGAAIAEAEAGPTGEFVTLFQTPPSAAPQTLTLTANDQPSEQSLLILPPAPPAAAEPEAPAAAPAPVAARPPAGTGSAAPSEPAEATGPVEIAAVDAPEAAEGTVAQAIPAETSATAAPAADGIQEPGTPAGSSPARVAATAIIGPDALPQVTQAAGAGTASRSGVTLASISYADEGLVTLAGLGTAGSALRVYVDDAFARDGIVEDDGRWALQLDGVAAGVYRLRIDEVRQDGSVASRVETPFQRDFPPAVQPGEPVTATAPLSVTVQPGNNLWTLARTHYGEGILYSQIFTANTDLIRDPDLIYPGQILALPEMHREAPQALSASGLPAPRP